MQRPVVVSSRTNEDHVIIDVHPHSPDPRRKTDQETAGGSDDLAAMEAGYNGDSSSDNRRGRRGGKSRFRMTAVKWIHAIPTIVFVCFFILWWCSYPVEIRDRRVIRIHSLHKLPQPLDEDHIDFTFLSVATSPSYAAASSISQESSDNTSSVTSSVNNETRADLKFLEMTSAAPSPYGLFLQEPSDNAASTEAHSPLGE